MSKECKTVRARFWGENDTEYLIEAEVWYEILTGGDYDVDVTILRCYENSDQYEVYPYDPGFNSNLRRNLEEAAFQAYDEPPTFPVVFPDETGDDGTNF